jgi:O-acetyl-ADP-ribose deacetylase (regulator of RNase III)
MIHNVAGDILLSKADLIAHGVAPLDDFKSGLALALRERYPSMYKDFRHYCKTLSPKAGTTWLWAGVGEGGKAVKVAALLTQEAPKKAGEHPGKAHLEYVNRALHDLKKLIEKEKFASLALPRVATGVGGLDWKEVLPLIQKVFGELKIPVFVYETFHKGQAASEPGLK